MVKVPDRRESMFFTPTPWYGKRINATIRPKCALLKGVFSPNPPFRLFGAALVC